MVDPHPSGFRAWCDAPLAILLLASLAGCNGPPMPLPDWMVPRVNIGEGFVEKKALLRIDAGDITDIQVVKRQPPAGLEIGVCTEQGHIIFVNRDGAQFRRAKLPGDLGDEFRLVNADGDAGLEVVRTGFPDETMTLYDDDGAKLWTYRVGSYWRWTYFHDLAITDLDGDGREELISLAGYPGSIIVLNLAGELRWRWKTDTRGNLHNLATMDIDHDGSPEVLTVKSGEYVIILDSRGTLLKKFRLEGMKYFGDWDVISWPSLNPSGPLLFVVHEQRMLFTMDGKLVQRLEGGYLFNPRVVAVRLRADEPPYLAVLGQLLFQGNLVVGLQEVHSQLSIYDSHGRLVYDEVIGEDCRSIATVPSTMPNEQRLLIGGEQAVWEYQRGVQESRQKFWGELPESR